MRITPRLGELRSGRAARAPGDGGAAPAAAGDGSARHLRTALALLGPAALIVAVAAAGNLVSLGTQGQFVTALVYTAGVIALYVFVGNSGVISFGQVSFIAVGAYAAGEMSIPTGIKPSFMPDVFPFIAHNSVGNIASLAIAAGVGGLFALIVGIPLMRLSGIAAGIATFAVLEITYNILHFWDKVGPAENTLSLVPETTGLLQATIGVLIVLVVAFLYQRSRAGRVLRASREDAAAAQAIGVHIHRQRLGAFVLSGMLSGLAGGLLVHQLGSLTTDEVFLDLTFIMLAMLIFGGAASLWGATIGALVLSFLDSYLSNAENGAHVFGAFVNLPSGTSTIILGVIMTLVILLRPSGITGGAEFGVPQAWLRRLRRGGGGPPRGAAAAATDAQASSQQARE